FLTFLTPLAFQFGQTVEDQILNPPDGVSLFRVDGNGFIANNFLDGWSDPDMLLVPGEGWFLSNPTNDPFTLTLVGTPINGVLTDHLQAGYSLCASLAPQAGLLSSVLAFPPASGAEVFVW